MVRGAGGGSVRAGCEGRGEAALRAGAPGGGSAGRQRHASAALCMNIDAGWIVLFGWMLASKEARTWPIWAEALAASPRCCCCCCCKSLTRKPDCCIIVAVAIHFRVRRRCGVLLGWCAALGLGASVHSAVCSSSKAHSYHKVGFASYRLHMQAERVGNVLVCACGFCAGRH